MRLMSEWVEIVVMCAVCGHEVGYRRSYRLPDKLAEVRCPKCQAVGHCHVRRILVRTSLR